MQHRGLITSRDNPLVQRLRRLLGEPAAYRREGLICIEDMRCFGQSRPKPDARMFRMVLARLKLKPEHCVLVEDTLIHQKTARGLGMATVWMQRWLRKAPHGRRLQHRPGYVSCRVRSLAALARSPQF